MKALALLSFSFYLLIGCSHSAEHSQTMGASHQVPKEDVNTKTMETFNSNTAILPAGEWTEPCRKSTMPKVLSFNSTYESANNAQLTWVVSSFKAKNCLKLHRATRSKFECKTSSNQKFGAFFCQQISYETSSDLTSWKTEPKLDHAGYPNNINMFVTSQNLRENTLDFIVVSEETEEPVTTVLQKKN